MREAPEIAPEIRGLLEELVADPRSSIRLVPRRPLRTWFDSDETIRPREVSGTKLERHLIEAHREELAQLLFEASRIAYWKDPGPNVRPIGLDGRLFDPATAEESWRSRAQGEAGAVQGDGDVTLVRECLRSIPPHLGLRLSLASLALVPCDRTRVALAECVPWSQPRTAIGFFRRLAVRPRPSSLLPDIMRFLAARLCSVDRLDDARSLYREATTVDPGYQVDWLCSLNLSCFLNEESSAADDAREMDKLLCLDDPRLAEARGLLRSWVWDRPRGDAANAMRVALGVAAKGYESAAILCGAFEA